MSGSALTLHVESCAECGLCVAVCAYDALILRPAALEILHEECVLCEACVVACPTDALAIVPADSRQSIAG